MNVDRITLDTNILIHAANIDAGQKHLLAIKVLERALQCDCVLTLQSLSEFFVELFIAKVYDRHISY